MNRSCGILFLFTLSLLFPACKKAVNNFQPPSATQEGLLLLDGRACDFDDVSSMKKKIKITLHEAKDHQVMELNTLMNFAGLPQNFKIYRSDIPTAMATIVNNQRLLIINDNLLADNSLDSAYWVDLFIVAHEIAHHLAYNLSDTANPVQAELDADIFAASILYRMGADSNQVLTAVASGLISNEADTKTHPSKYKRLEAIKKSWLKTFELRYQPVVPPPVDDFLAVKEFTNKNLLLNSTILCMYPEVLRDPNDPSTQQLKPLLKNMEGIVMQIGSGDKPGPVHPCENNVIKLIVEVLVTKIDTANQNVTWAGEPMIANKSYKFEVWYEAIPGRDTAEDLHRFFVTGRRFEFDVVNLYYEELGVFPSNISRARTIYNSY